jgi:hypothetical protein
VHTEFVTVGRVTIADIDVHGSLFPSAGPIAEGVDAGAGVGVGPLACAIATVGTMKRVAVIARRRITFAIVLLRGIESAHCNVAKCVRQ